MDGTESAEVGRTEPAPNVGHGWKTPLSLGIVLFLIYLANGRMIGAGDAQPATLLPISLIRGDGPYLDRFERILRMDGELPYFATESRGHLVSRYPLAPALFALPLTWPQVVFLDQIRPGWEEHFPAEYAALMAKTSQAILAALTGVVLFSVLGRLGLGRTALLTTSAAALGSSLWSVGSQAPWQHGATALSLTAAIWFLAPRPLSKMRLILAGLATALLVACRTIDIVFAFAIVGWIAVNRWRDLLWFLPPPMVIGAALVGYNLLFFGAIEGGQSQLEALHPEVHKVVGTWTGDLLGGAAGTLLSPSRGLFIFTPWIVPALALLPAAARRLKEHSLVIWLMSALLPYAILLSKYSCWWGGWVFGPRFWTDAIPVFALPLGFALDWARSNSRSALHGIRGAIAFSVVVQLIGVFYYPSSWNVSPIAVDSARERLWDWKDSELTRCLHEGVHPAAFRPWSRGAVASAVGVPRQAGRRPRALSWDWLTGRREPKVRR